MHTFSKQNQQPCETSKMMELLRADLEQVVEVLLRRTEPHAAGPVLRSWYALPAAMVTSPQVPERVLMLGLFT